MKDILHNAPIAFAGTEEIDIRAEYLSIQDLVALIQATPNLKRLTLAASSLMTLFESSSASPDPDQTVVSVSKLQKICLCADRSTTIPCAPVHMLLDLFVKILPVLSLWSVHLDTHEFGGERVDDVAAAGLACSAGDQRVLRGAAIDDDLTTSLAAVLVFRTCVAAASTGSREQRNRGHPGCEYGASSSPHELSSLGLRVGPIGPGHTRCADVRSSSTER